MNALINSNIPLTEYFGPLTSGEIIRLGKHLGWEEKRLRGKSSHRCLLHPGFRPASVPCHGEGQELDKGLVCKLANHLYQPLQSIDADLPETINSQFQTWLVNGSVAL